MLALGRRKRRLALWATLAAVSGYTAYKLYTSDSGRRKRQQLARLINVWLLLGDAAYQTAESLALLSSDVKRFLLSDGDELPRSLRQAFKVALSPDFQHSCTLVSAAITRGLVRGITAPRPTPPPRPSPSVDEPPCTEIKEICLISCVDSPGSHKERKQHFQRNERTNSGAKPIGPSIYADKLRQHTENKPSENIVERLLSKLFSEPGKQFASTVVGNAACNVVNALFDGFGSMQTFSSSAGKEREASSYVVEMLCTHQCKVLINECMETFVNTAVAVYIDKTKDTNFYEDMVAGVTNPLHKDSMKDLLTAVCNGAVETLVKSSHCVIFGNKEGQLESGVSNQALHCRAAEEISCGLEIQNQMALHTRAKHYQSRFMNTDGSFYPSDRVENSCVFLRPATERIMQEQEIQEEASHGMSEKWQQEKSGVYSFIDGVSKTLAIPSNHRLVVDVAGTMTSEAIRSFADVIVSTLCKNMHIQMQKGWGRVKAGASLIENKVTCSDAAVKAFLLASICLALCLHLLTCIRMELV